MFGSRKPFLQTGPVPAGLKVWDMGLGVAERAAERQESKKMHIFVKTLTGDTLQLQINNDETAAQVICETLKAKIDASEFEVESNPCKEVKLVVVGCGGVGKSAIIIQTCFGQTHASIKKDTEIEQLEELWNVLENDFQSKIFLLEKEEKLLKHKPKKVYPPRQHKPQPRHNRRQKPRKSHRR